MSCKYHTDIPCTAFSAGWLVSQLHGPILDRATTEKSSLPTVNELSRSDRVSFTFAELENLFPNALSDAVRLDTIANVQSLVDKAKATWNLDAPNEVTGLCHAIEELHVGLLKTLTASNHQLGIAYIVGRSLSNTCWLPRSRANFDDQFNKYRLANIQVWLAEVKQGGSIGTLVGHGMASDQKCTKTPDWVLEIPGIFK